MSSVTLGAAYDGMNLRLGGDTASEKRELWRALDWSYSIDFICLINATVLAMYIYTFCIFYVCFCIQIIV